MKLMTIQDKKAWDGALLTNTSKMPCKSFGFSPDECITGRKLAKVPGSVCASCYATKGNYAFKGVRRAHAARFFQMNQSMEGFESRMIEAVRAEGKPYFRWHDSGDIQSVRHLQMIFAVCVHTPNVKHWMPTREYGILRKAKKLGIATPSNLTIRVSAPMIDGKAPRGFDCTSTVHKNSPAIGTECKAYTRGGECGKCRKCWDATVSNISYPIH